MNIAPVSFDEFLYKALKKSFLEQQVEVSEEADFYVHNLLTEYLRIAKFNTVSGFSDTEKPLAVMVSEAYKAQTISEQLWRLVAIGDHTFFISSFFSGQLNRHFHNLDYCIGIGSSSYLQACDLCALSEKNLSKLYHELGVRFEDLVIVATYALESVSEK